MLDQFRRSCRCRLTHTRPYLEVKNTLFDRGLNFGTGVFDREEERKKEGDNALPDVELKLWQYILVLGTIFYIVIYFSTI